MLDRGDRGAGAVADHGAERGLADVAPFRLDEAVAAVGQAGAQENDAVIGVGGMKDDAGGSGGMDADAMDLNAIGERLLKPDASYPVRRPCSSPALRPTRIRLLWRLSAQLGLPDAPPRFRRDSRRALLKPIRHMRR